MAADRFARAVLQSCPHNRVMLDGDVAGQR
jgi:hypothetical protein